MHFSRTDRNVELKLQNFYAEEGFIPRKGLLPIISSQKQWNELQKNKWFPPLRFRSIVKLILLRTIIFDVLGTPDDISFITDERARNYIKSFGKIEKKPFSKIYDYMPAEVEDFL